MKVAILHYWFLQSGGGERCISSLLSLYPEADVFCLFANKHHIPTGLAQARLHCSFLNDIPLAQRMSRALFPLYPAAVGAFDFAGYDLVISSDSPPIKAIVTPMDTIHISYCHTPGRFIWDLAPAFHAKLPGLARPVFAACAARARLSDYVAAQRVDHFCANSKNIQRRIAKFYHRDSEVIYPPVETSKGYISKNPCDYYLTVGRLVDTKRLDLLIQACNLMKRRLLISGEGREERRLKSAAGSTVEFLGRVPDADLSVLYANCRAFLFAADEDFGITPVEAQSFGRPVIAYGHGGVLETIRTDDQEGRSDTGVFFREQSVESVVEGIMHFEAREGDFIPTDIKQHAQQFNSTTFADRMKQCVDTIMGYKSEAKRLLRFPPADYIPVYNVSAASHRSA